MYIKWNVIVWYLKKNKLIKFEYMNKIFFGYIKNNNKIILFIWINEMKFWIKYWMK